MGAVNSCFHRCTAPIASVACAGTGWLGEFGAAILCVVVPGGGGAAGTTGGGGAPSTAGAADSAKEFRKSGVPVPRDVPRVAQLWSKIRSVARIGTLLQRERFPKFPFWHTCDILAHPRPNDFKMGPCAAARGRSRWSKRVPKIGVRRCSPAVRWAAFRSQNIARWKSRVIPTSLSWISQFFFSRLHSAKQAQSVPKIPKLSKCGFHQNLVCFGRSQSVDGRSGVRRTRNSSRSAASLRACGAARREPTFAGL